MDSRNGEIHVIERESVELTDNLEIVLLDESMRYRLKT